MAVIKKYVVFLFAILAAASLSGAPVLKGSMGSLQKQRAAAKKAHLTPIQDEEDLARLKRAGLLVRIPEDRFVQVDPRLPQKLRYARPFVIRFLEEKGRESVRKFGVPLRVNSAVRTVEYQNRLRKKNRNATKPANSSHVYGTTVDLARFVKINGKKVWYPTKQQDWLRKELRFLEKHNLIEATQEKYDAVFHVMVFPSYVRRG